MRGKFFSIYLRRDLREFVDFFLSENIVRLFMKNGFLLDFKFWILMYGILYVIYFCVLLYSWIDIAFVLYG